MRRFGPTLNGHLEKFSVLEQAKTLKRCTDWVSERHCLHDTWTKAGTGGVSKSFCASWQGMTDDRQARTDGNVSDRFAWHGLVTER